MARIQDTIDQAFAEGVLAAQQGLTLRDNPYKRGDPFLYSAWRDGVREVLYYREDQDVA